MSDPFDDPDMPLLLKRLEAVLAYPVPERTCPSPEVEAIFDEFRWSSLGMAREIIRLRNMVGRSGYV